MKSIWRQSVYIIKEAVRQKQSDQVESAGKNRQKVAEKRESNRHC
jgi:hypothetical protein